MIREAKLSVLILLTCLLFLQNTWAGRPASCPNVSSIKPVPLIYSSNDNEYQYYLYVSVEKYATPYTWMFVLGVPYNQAISSNDGLNKAQSALGTLTGNPQPEEYEPGRWVCVYNNNYNYLSAAFTPVDVGMDARKSQLLTLTTINVK